MIDQMDPSEVMPDWLKSLENIVGPDIGITVVLVYPAGEDNAHRIKTFSNMSESSVTNVMNHIATNDPLSTTLHEDPEPN